MAFGLSSSNIVDVGPTDSHVRYMYLQYLYLLRRTICWALPSLTITRTEWITPYFTFRLFLRRTLFYWLRIPSGLPTSGLATWWAIFTNASLRSIIMTIIIIIILRVDHASNCVEMGLSMIKWGKFCIEFLTSFMPFSSNYRFDRAVDLV